MTIPVIYLTAPANPAREVLEATGAADAAALIRRVQAAVGARYRVAGKASLIDAAIDDDRGGRRDDAARVRELHTALADDRIAAIVALRGGGWMTRLLSQFDVTAALDKRRTPVAVFGFSEITPLINMVGGHRQGRGYYYMTPGFPRKAMVRYARLNVDGIAQPRVRGTAAAERRAQRWARQRFDGAFDDYFREVVDLLEGRPPRRPFTGRLVAGRLSAESRAVLIGGCLSVSLCLTTAALGKHADPKGKWIALEDLEETPQRIDRQLALLKLAGWFDRCAGVLIGDFHEGDTDQTDLVLAMLKYHLPQTRRLPVIVSKDLGHTWPQSVLPLGRGVKIRREGSRGKVTIAWRYDDWRVLTPSTS